ncbi:MAG TPA: radical SAM family heme chaperone HemW [Phycisphaerae bacterium]|nr:radical SAM family heme chaperone HemW [Phycisphaerae bacterium]
MVLNLLQSTVRADFAARPGALAALLRSEVATVDALYVHVPFCASKCHYCDFYSLAGHLEEGDAFLGALEREIVLHRGLLGGRLVRPRTIFIGGGTPTLLSPGQLGRLMGSIRGAIDAAELIEFTVEANPNTFDAEKAAVLASAGVNRVSFGAQSFIAEELRTLQRDHDPESVPAAFATARAAGISNLNVDLIFGIPGQTLQSLEHSMERALALRPRHLSVYSLIYEPNTAMTARLHRGEFAPIDEELELAMFELVHGRLGAAGFERYEISNHAQAGFECRHNLQYWQARNWLAWGPSAAAQFAAPVGEPRAWRWKNVGSLAHYLEALREESPVLPWTGMEARSTRQWVAEAATFWLRLASGLRYGEFAGHVGADAAGVRDALEGALRQYAELGLVELRADRARITDAGVLVSNRIFADVLAGFGDLERQSAE